VAIHNPQVPCLEDQVDQDDHPDDGLCDAQPNIAVVWIFLFSLYWSQQVFKNILNVVTAGTVGTWWFCSENGTNDSAAASFGWACGFRDVGDSLYRALSYSFGSICLGSLLVAILQLLESMLSSACHHRRGSALLLCVLECLVHLLRRWIEYFNAWAMVYVGLYGYDYLTAGKNVVNLFKTTGWTTFIADRLVYRALMLCQLGIAVLTGIFSVLMDMVLGPVFVDDNSDGNQDLGSQQMSFLLGMFLGLFLSSTVLTVVESAVRTVIVCFAESPGEFAMHHPDLCAEMTRGWSETYPDAWATRHVPVMADACVTTTHTDTDAEARGLVV
jgi:Plasma-membrane choline transporter